MNNTKAVIAVLVHVALIVFVVFAIWPALKGGGTDRYHTKTAGVIVTQSAVEEIDEAAMTETDDASMEAETVETAVEEVEMPVAVEAVTEQVEVVEAAIEDVVDEAEAVVLEEKPAMEERVIEVAAVAVEEPPAMGGGKVHIVTAQGLKYSPLVSVIAVGDTVAWEKMGSHDTQAIEGLVPEGAEMWHSSMGENFQRTFSQEGIYIYKCTPHWGAAMGGVIIVGKPVNLEAIKAATVKGAAKRLVKKALKAAAAM
ncbi:MAG: copper-binding protein [Gammaproteobacteria bacterium]|nr:MAG: copper-binding protein [Gammaproteobacteria bacterium]